jgi:hypothetical protein
MEYLVRRGRDPAVLSAAPQRLLARAQALGRRSRRISPGEYSLSRRRRIFAPADFTPAENSRAALATAIFALHPLYVESVAWITEQKNALSAVFYFGAMLTYLRFDEERRRSSYFLALGLFVAGLLTKTVTATLPAALLVIFWWRRGRLSWRRDVRPLVPWFALGARAAAGPLGGSGALRCGGRSARSVDVSAERDLSRSSHALPGDAR